MFVDELSLIVYLFIFRTKFVLLHLMFYTTKRNEKAFHFIYVKFTK